MHEYWISKCIAENLTWIANNSFVNCHVQGVDSILFDNTPGRRIRMFLANPNHLLFNNLFRSGRPLSAGYHPHHCDIILDPIFGKITNEVVVTNAHYGDAWSRWKLNKFEYQSKITNGSSSFKFISKELLILKSSAQVSSPTHLKSTDIHTIHVPKNRAAAWFVYEGKEDPNYKPVCWSNQQLDKVHSPKGLYSPMNEKYLLSILKTYNLLV